MRMIMEMVFAALGLIVVTICIYSIGIVYIHYKNTKHDNNPDYWV